MPPTPDDEFTELVDADIPRVDLVDKAANGTVFFLAKSASEGSRGLFGADFVRDLIAKAGPGERPAAEQMLTPAQAMALVHAASVRKTGDLDATTVLADADSSAPGNPDEPGSPAWEAVDAASARKWTGLLVRARNALCALADREGLESVTADPDDLGHALDLKDAAAAVDCAVGILARFAVDEQAEADLAGDDAAMVGKAVATLDVTALETLEAFGPVVKAGRVLSGSNESAIRDAIAALQRVLAALPAAPTDDGQQVAKTKETTVLSIETNPAPKPVAKAKGDAMLVVYNADGTAIGVCKPDAVMSIADGPATADDAPAAPPVAAGEDAAVIPGTQTVAAPAPTPEAPMTKSTDGVKKTKKKQSKQDARLTKALGEAVAPLAEGLAQIAQLASVVDGLQERVAKQGGRPDDRNSPLFNGANGVTGTATHDGTADPLAELRKAIEDAPTPAAKQQATAVLGFEAIKRRFAGEL